ncbi:glycosyltransferase family 2 protein, partial [Humibacter sp.]|uniref:glycosyltransferase family 2 protein n=1 Tax=Humibacter sp. TaxID=1940291 RepID=UPI002BF0B68F
YRSQVARAEPSSEGPLVIIVAYHGDDDLRGCLATLGGSARVVVVDNAPGGGAAAIAADAGSGYLASPSNIGFSAAVNAALTRSWDGMSDVLLLNPDARVTPSQVSVLVARLHADRCTAAVAPRLTGTDGSAQRVSWPVPSPAQVWAEALGGARLWHGPEFLIGAVLLLRGEALAAVGPFDERYFLYAEEADWQLRAQRAGWTVGVVDDVIATHAGARSSSDPAARERHFHRSAAAFARRWYGPLGWQIMRGGSIIAAGRRLITSDPIRRAEASRTLRTYVRRADGEPR